MLAFLKLLWKNWKRFVHGINSAISWVLMSATYITAVGPVAIAMKLARSPLLDRSLGDPESTTCWQPLPPDVDDIRRVQRPW